MRRLILALALAITANTVLALAFVAWFYRWDVLPVEAMAGAYAHDRWTGKTYVWSRLYRMGEIVDYPTRPAWSDAPLAPPAGFEIVEPTQK